jgi:hypothetical protein
VSGDRVVLTLATVAFGLGVSLLMLRGWRSRLRRQGDVPPPPPAPAVPGDLLAPAVSGLYVGTTYARDWLDRVVAHGLSNRAPAWLRVHSDGARIDREGGATLYLPLDSIRAAEVGDALAGKVVGKGGLLLLDWDLGGVRVTTGFRADDHADHRRLADVITAHLPVRKAS